MMPITNTAAKTIKDHNNVGDKDEIESLNHHVKPKNPIRNPIIAVCEK